MSNKIKPEQRKGPRERRESPTDESLGVQRNERIYKNAERQMRYERKNRDPPGKEVEKPKSAMKIPSKDSPSVDEFGSTRVDAVVFVVVLAQIVGCVAVGFEIYAYSMDQEWNRIANGKAAIDELEGHAAFKTKTLKLKGHVYLEKALEYCTRDEPLEIVFIVFILSFVIISFIQIIACYVKAADVENYAIVLVGLYAVVGAACIFLATFPVVAAINIENSYTYAAQMLHNFRYIDPDDPLTSTQQDMCNQKYKNGCDYYEYAKLQSKILEGIFRLCGAGSRFTRYYYHEQEDQTSIQIEGETYYRSELKEIGFCSRDGYKFTAATCAIITGVIYSMVPIVFCCQGRSTKKEGYYSENDTIISRKEGIVKQKETEEASEPKPQEKKRSSAFDPTAAIEQFRKYVEKDSD